MSGRKPLSVGDAVLVPKMRSIDGRVTAVIGRGKYLVRISDRVGTIHELARKDLTKISDDELSRLHQFNPDDGYDVCPHGYISGECNECLEREHV